MSASHSHQVAGAPLLGGAGLRRLWWGLVIAGLAVIALGVVMLAHVATTTRVLGVIVGLSLIVAGVASFGDAGRRSLPWPAYLLGAVTLAGGIIVLAWPGETLRLLEIVIGVTLIVAGVVRLSIGLVMAEPVSWPAVVVGLVTLAVGVAVLAWPGATVWVIGVVVGIGMLIGGIDLIVAGMDLRSAARR
jgi:uncharacterized membrane protein HdeD (DUF308 family)